MFGHHGNCSPDFCSSARDQLQRDHLIQEMQTLVETETDDAAGGTENEVACKLDLYKKLTVLYKEYLLLETQARDPFYLQSNLSYLGTILFS